jgi:hypothetical protein
MQIASATRTLSQRAVTSETCAPVLPPNEPGTMSAPFLLSRACMRALPLMFSLYRQAARRLRRATGAVNRLVPASNAFWSFCSVMVMVMVMVVQVS